MESLRGLFSHELAAEARDGLVESLEQLIVCARQSYITRRGRALFPGISRYY